MNPFKYGQVVSGGDFCPRPDAQKQLASYIQSGQNVVVYGERRIGKTSLIYETLTNSSPRRMLHIDLMDLKSLEDLHARMAKAILSMEQRSGSLEKIFSLLAGLRPALTLDPYTGQPSFSIDAPATTTPNSIEGLLDLIEKLNQKKPLAVFIDEFQDILNLSDANHTFALLRSKIQFHQDIPYLFAGSIRNAMWNIFTHPDNAFYKSALPMEVGTLNRDLFSDFLLQKFKAGGRRITPALLEEIFKLTDQVAGDVQELCGTLWETSDSGDALDESALGNALERIYGQEAKGYESCMVLLTALQVKCLVGLARVGGEAPFSTRFLQEAGIATSASVTKTLNRLMKLKIIFKHEKDYRFTNPFFKNWLLWKKQ